LNNLYVKSLAKELTADELRRAFARYGKISSFNLVNKPEYSTNIAFVGFVYPDNAKAALENVLSDLGKFEVYWHRAKSELRNDLI
jgi:RNA recognition motif-containing protein